MKKNMFLFSLFSIPFFNPLPLCAMEQATVETSTEDEGSLTKSIIISSRSNSPLTRSTRTITNSGITNFKETYEASGTTAQSNDNQTALTCNTNVSSEIAVQLDKTVILSAIPDSSTYLNKTPSTPAIAIKTITPVEQSKNTPPAGRTLMGLIVGEDNSRGIGLVRTVSNLVWGESSNILYDLQNNRFNSKNTSNKRILSRSIETLINEDKIKQVILIIKSCKNHQPPVRPDGTACQQVHAYLSRKSEQEKEHLKTSLQENSSTIIQCAFNIKNEIEEFISEKIATLKHLDEKISSEQDNAIKQASRTMKRLYDAKKNLHSIHTNFELEDDDTCSDEEKILQEELQEGDQDTATEDELQYTTSSDALDDFQDKKIILSKIDMEINMKVTKGMIKDMFIHLNYLQHYLSSRKTIEYAAPEQTNTTSL